MRCSCSGDCSTWWYLPRFSSKTRSLSGHFRRSLSEWTAFRIILATAFLYVPSAKRQALEGSRARPADSLALICCAPRCPRDGAAGRRERSDARPASGFGRGATASMSRPPNVTPIARGQYTSAFTSFNVPVILIPSRSECSSETRWSWALWTELRRLVLAICEMAPMPRA